MPRALHRFRGSARGYILTITAIVALSLAGIAIIMFGGQIRNYLAKRYVTNLITDSNATDDAFVIGKPVNYGICEEPTVLCPDPGYTLNSAGAAVASAGTDLFAWVGVRPDRFVTRNQVYYAGTDCTPPAIPAGCDPTDPADPDCPFLGLGVYLAPPATASGTFPPVLPVGYLNGSLDVDGTTADRVVYGVGSPSDYPCSLGVDCDDGGVLWRGDDTVLAGTAIQSVWTSLAPDCAPGEVAGVPSPLTEPVPILAAWDFKNATVNAAGDEATASYVDTDRASVSTAGCTDCMRAGDRPANSPDPPGYAQFGPQPNTGCNCAANIACVCDGRDEGSPLPSLSSYYNYSFTGQADAPAAGDDPTVTLRDATPTSPFLAVPVGTPGATVTRNEANNGTGTATATTSATITHTALTNSQQWTLNDDYTVSGTNSYLEFAVSCKSSLFLTNVSVRFNARKVTNNDVGNIHLLARPCTPSLTCSADPFQVVALSSPASNSLTNDFKTVYEYKISDVLSVYPNEWTVRIHSERTLPSDTRFDARLDDVTFSAFCGASGATAGPNPDGFTTEICLNTAQTLDLVAAGQVATSGGVNVLSGFDPLYTISPAILTKVDPAAEAATKADPDEGGRSVDFTETPDPEG